MFRSVARAVLLLIPFLTRPPAQRWGSYRFRGAAVMTLLSEGAETSDVARK